MTAPAGLPLLGHALAFLRNKPGFLLRVAREHGPHVRLQIGGPTWLLNDPTDVKHVLVDGAARYDKTSKLTSPRGRALSGEGLHTATGADHLFLRRMVQPLFHRRVVEGHARVVASAMDRLEAHWGHGVATRDAWQAMLQLSQQVMLGALFGEAFRDRDGAMTTAVTARRSYIEHFFTSNLPRPEWWPLPIVWQYRTARRRIHAVIAVEMARRRREGSEGDDWLSMLVASTGRDGTPLSDRQVRDEAVTLTSTGYETVGAALVWTLHLLAEHPEWQEAARSAAHAEGPAAPLLTRILNESMRLFPPTWLFIREPNAADTLPSGIAVRPGEKLYLCPYTMHREPAWWTTPERFNPDHFTEEAMRNRPRFAYFPFGGGARQCLGEPFARMECLHVLARLLPRYRIEPVQSGPIALRPSIVLEPRGGLPLRFIPIAGA